MIIPLSITSRQFLTDPDFVYPASIADALSIYPSVVVGRVEDVLQRFDPRPGYLGLPESYIRELEAAPPGKGGPIPSDILARPPGSGSSIYAVRVLANVVGEGPRENGMFALLQPGGVFENVAYENTGDPVVLPGSTYLFFLGRFDLLHSNYHLPEGYEDLPDDYQQIYVGPPYHRYLIADGRLQSVNSGATSNCPGCGDPLLVGHTLYEAITLIRDANRRPEVNTRIAGNTP